MAEILRAEIQMWHLDGKSEAEIIAGLPTRSDKDVTAAFMALNAMLGKEAMVETVCQIRSGITAAEVLKITEPVIRAGMQKKYPEQWPTVQELHALAVEAVVRTNKIFNAAN